LRGFSGALRLGAFALCHSRGIVFSSAVILGVLVLVVVVTAANQIYRWSVL
jgi:hypothetical protein